MGASFVFRFVMALLIIASTLLLQCPNTSGGMCLYYDPTSAYKWKKNYRKMEKLLEIMLFFIFNVCPPHPLFYINDFFQKYFPG